MSKSIALWEAPKSDVIPASAKTAKEITSYATQLRQRDQKQIVKALEAEQFDMASTFVWVKAMAALRKQLAQLGSEFIGEMLQRPDIDSFSDLTSVITDSEAIMLAEDLGSISSTEAMRLRHAHETIRHFAEFDTIDDDDDEIGITYEEAVGCLRACVQSVLGHPKLEVAQDFAEFRRQLEDQTFSEDSDEIVNLITSPYFFWKTTISILLALLKTSKGAQLEHAVRNTDLILPLLWEKLRKPERWQAGQTYAELYAEGKTEAANGLKKALLKIAGFDYVPENLRSSTFTKAAKDVLEAHENFGNFYNEPGPMKALASLGTTIPSPAFPICMTATLSVWLGNSYGCSWAAIPSANSIVRALSQARWAYYINDALPGDRSILFKLAATKPAHRWIELLEEYEIGPGVVENRKVRSLINAANKKQVDNVNKAALVLYKTNYR